MKCKYCQAEIEQDAQFCTNCGKNLSMFDKCVKCGELLDSDTAFCPYCGTEQPRYEDAEESEKRTSYMKIFIAILGILLLGGLGYYLSSRSNADGIGSTNDDPVETSVTNSKESLADDNSTKNSTKTSEDITSPGKAIDLGLPSGVKWASCNVGASKPEEYGGYYAWGETEEKEVYDWSTYKWCNGLYNSQTKYCTKSSYGTVDNNTVLDLEDDVAHVKWGGSWRMPTLDEVKELFENTTCEWTTLNGVNGRKFTSKMNGNSIFLPAAGMHDDFSGLRDVGSRCEYWSSSLFESGSYGAYILQLSSETPHWEHRIRFDGQSVRPVR